MADIRPQVGEAVVVHLEAMESALDRGDVPMALSYLSRTRRWLLGEDSQPSSPQAPLPVCLLTEREAATLRLLPDACLSQKDIARELGVSRNTVKSHLKSVYMKLGVHCRAEAIQEARRMGLIGARPIVTDPTDALPADSSVTLLRS